ncbi:P-loop containing nucleoside triphosphate hydrolase protein [Coniochaeta sp. 2T2.1]|nr:P-loop containing nucleoside triphosphate hydrolase protein [Coniochaeta sp. 2T2.1]
MANNLGVWHTTTLQSAQKQAPGYQTTTVIGLKRTIDQVQDSVPNGGTAKQPNQFRPASTLPKGPPRLTASAIEYINDEPLGPSEYTQRKEFAFTPRPTQDPSLSLSHRIYGLPEQLVANFTRLGIKSIYPWQKHCLLGPGILNGEKNLVYSAPTGGGKSLVADILMLKQMFADRDAKAMLVLPYVALVQEKVRWLRNIVEGISRRALGQIQKDEAKTWARRPDKDTIRVVGFFGGGKVRATWHDFDIGVCTIEKANALVNAAIDDCSISKLKIVVLDELHMIDDDYRGYLMELMATKIMCLSQQVQIVGMSATLTNINLLKAWLQGHCYETRYRPIPIEEHLVCDGKVFPAETTSQLLKTATQLNGRTQPTSTQLQPTKLIKPSPHKEFSDPVLNAVVALANETARSGYGALVFAGSRAGCESDALLISRVMAPFSEADLPIQEKRIDLLADLRSLTTGLDRTLEQTIPCGVGFHHAGLTIEERELVANGYDSGVLKIIVATCSLAAGINLPARRVILHNARMGRDFVGPSLLRQMRGRAGRKGKDEVGETYLCCQRKDLESVVDLMHAELPQISSCLISDKRRVQRAILEAIAIRLATSQETLDDYISKTMLSLSAEVDSIQQNVRDSLADLEAMGFIAVDKFSNYEATRLGKAIVASAFDPEDGVFIHREMQTALQGFVMDGDMHVLYTFTPVYDLGGTPINWRVFWNEMEQLDESGLRVMKFLGLKPTVVNRMLHGATLKETTPEEKDIARRYQRFYLALQLRDLCNEMPIHRVAQKYDTPRGAVQTLAQTCEGFAAGMIKFCQHMGWGAMGAALDHFSDRLKAGARSDLLDLARITFVKSRTARVFWDNGFKTVAAVANADPRELVPVLVQAQPTKVRLETRDEEKYTEKLLAKAKIIAGSANRIWQIQMQQELEDE